MESGATSATSSPGLSLEDNDGPGVDGGGVDSSAAGELVLEGDDKDAWEDWYLGDRTWVVTMGGVGSGWGRRAPFSRCRG